MQHAVGHGGLRQVRTHPSAATLAGLVIKKALAYIAHM